MNFFIYSSICENKLSVTAAISNTNEFTKYAYYLYNGTNIIQKQGYSKNSTCSFELSKTGRYHIKVFVQTKDSEQEEYKRYSKISDVHVYYSNVVDNEYIKFFNTHFENKLKPLTYQSYELPYQDILLAYDTSEESKKTYEAIKNMSSSIELKYTSLHEKALLVYSECIYKEGNSTVAFSGTGRTNTKMIYGMHDIDSLSCANELSEQVGTFCLIRANENQIMIETDYFGTDKLYYFMLDSLFLVSNRFHLIVMAMQKLNIPRYPNLPHIYAYLTETFYTQQNFSQTTNIINLINLRSDSRICVDLNIGKVQIEKTDLYYALSRKILYKESSYYKLVEQACKEIVNNLKIAFEHNAFEHYVVHLTGGLDSRLVFAALTKFPEYKDKVLVSTSASSDDDKDLLSACRILSKRKYSFGTPPLDYTRKTLYTDGYYRALSTVLGVTAEHTECSNALPFKKTCVLPGVYGDYLGRPYLSKTMRGTNMGETTMSDTEFWKKLVIRHTGFALYDVHDFFQETFVKECLSLPGTTNLDKLDNHYLFYRNGFHFSYARRFRPTAPMWGVIQSKALLALKMMTSNLNMGIKVQLDLIRYFDEEIASIEFANDKYEKERKELNECFGVYPLCTEYDETVIKEILEEWKLNKKMNGAVSEPNFPKQDALYNTDTTLFILHTLAHKLNMPDIIACNLYNCIKENGSTLSGSRYSRLLRKLYSLYYELF